MPEPDPSKGFDSERQGLPLCRSGDLAEKGQALVFDVLHFREPARAFEIGRAHV